MWYYEVKNFTHQELSDQILSILSHVDHEEFDDTLSLDDQILLWRRSDFFTKRIEEMWLWQNYTLHNSLKTNVPDLEP